MLTEMIHDEQFDLQSVRSQASAYQHVDGHQAIEAGDDGTNDMLVSEVIRTNELQVWFVSQNLVGASARIE